MDAQPKSDLQAQREAQFVQDVGAFVRRDFEAIEQKMRSDVVITSPARPGSGAPIEASTKWGAASSD